ncbi:MAG: thioredoxin family protein [Salinisphaeraceae bacterium]
MTGTTRLTPRELEQRLADDGRPLLVTFIQPDCPWCERQIPQLDELAGQWGDHVDIALVDLADDPSLVQTHELRGAPTLMLFDAGKRLGVKNGFQRRQQLDAFLQHHVGDAE